MKSDQNTKLRRAPICPDSTLKVMLIAGEASSDEHGAQLVNSLLASTNAVVFGMGGSALRKAGMDTVVDSETSASVMGLTEVVGSLRKIILAFQTLKREAELRKPDIAVLIDYPDFNLRMAKVLHSLKIPVLYFITPQIWAWRSGRVKTIKKYVTKVAPIFPFEQEYFQRHGVTAEYVGHPFLDRPPLVLDRNSFLRDLGLNPEKPVLALLPGSRKSEVSLLLQVMLEAFDTLNGLYPGLQAVIPVARTLSTEFFMEQVGDRKGVVVAAGVAREVLNVADAGVVASGTATVEAALAKLPFVAVYRLSAFTYSVARVLVRGVRHFAMANLIIGRKVVPELLQNEVNAKNIVRELEPILSNPEYRERVRAELSQVEVNLKKGISSEGTTAMRAVRIINQMTSSKLLEARSGSF